MNKTGKLIIIFCLLLLTATGWAQITTETGKLKGKRVLFVVTSHDQLGNSGRKTGVWLHEFADPYYTLMDQGAEITIVSPKGGNTPIDPVSLTPDFTTPASKRFNSDKEVKNKLAHTLMLANVTSNKYDAVFYPGGHGPMWDLAEDPVSTKLIESFSRQNKIIAFVCHAPIALKNVKDVNGQPLIKGKKVAGFTNSEEEGVKLTKVVPYLLEDVLKEKGGDYQKGADWQPFVVSDGLLITGQNPASAKLVAEEIIKKLSTHASK